MHLSSYGPHMNKYTRLCIALLSRSCDFIIWQNSKLKKGKFVREVWGGLSYASIQRLKYNRIKTFYSSENLHGTIHNLIVTSLLHHDKNSQKPLSIKQRAFKIWNCPNCGFTTSETQLYKSTVAFSTDCSLRCIILGEHIMQITTWRLPKLRVRTVTCSH